MKKLNFSTTFKAGLLAAGLSAIVNVMLFFIFHSSGIITDDIEIQPGQPMTIVPIIISSIVPTLIATLVFFLLEKYTSKGYTIFMIISIVLGLLSFANPFFGIPQVTTAYALALNAMHITVVVFLLYFLKRAKNNNA